MDAKVSVIIVNHNGEKWLPECIRSVVEQNYEDSEIILVDNASNDSSVHFVKSNYPEVIVIQNDENAGFAGGNNIGIKRATGAFVLFLNNDATLGDDFFKDIIHSFSEIPNLGLVQPKILLADRKDTMDSCGAYWTDTTFFYTYGYGKNQELPKYNKPMPFFNINGAVMFCRKDVIDAIGLFDDSFWSFCEEIDFCNRLWLAGYECWYYPRATAFHARAKTSAGLAPSYVQFYDHKNRLTCMLKNLEVQSLVKYIPIHLVLVTLLSFIYLLQGKVSAFLSIYRAIWYNIVHLRKTIEKRKIVQSFRKKRDKDLFKITKKNPRLTYYYFLLGGFEGRARYED